MSKELRLYSREEWAAMTDHDRELIAEDRRRIVEAYLAETEERRRLVDELTTERYHRAR